MRTRLKKRNGSPEGNNNILSGDDPTFQITFHSRMISRTCSPMYGVSCALSLFLPSLFLFVLVPGLKKTLCRVILFFSGKLFFLNYNIHPRGIFHENVPVVRLSSERGSGGRHHRKPQIPCPRRLCPARFRRHLLSAARRQARHRQDRSHHPPGNGPRRRPGSPDAGCAAGRSLDGNRSLPDRRRRASPVHRPQQQGDGPGHDARGSQLPDCPHGDQQLQAAAGHDLPDPDQVPRRGASASSP